MGFSLEISIPLAPEVTIGDVLAPAFGGRFFQPIALGAIEWHTSGNHWFLSGYALEHFLSLVLARKIDRPPASLSLFTSQDVELNHYQQQCADAVRGVIPWRWPRSPFERVDEQCGVTVLEPKHLTHDALVGFTHWAERFRQATSVVYGTIPLEFRRPSESSWLRAFREIGSTEENQFASLAPFLSLHLYTTGPFVGQRLVIRTQSYIWLRQALALGGRVSPADADANLHEFASFARTLAQGKRLENQAVELSMDGRFYTREEPQLRAAFRDIL
jgi:hypothetical protein